MRVLFWGTPDFAAPALRALLGEGFEVVGVVTQPDRPVGRSRSTLEQPPVKRIALEEGLPVLQPERPRGKEFLEEAAGLGADLSVVIAYGHILKPEVIDLPRLGTINVHASLLPALRGAAPIQRAILAGIQETGVTIMRMVPALDAGPIIHQVTTPVLEDETTGELQLRLAELGALALVEAVALMQVGRAEERPQDEALATYAPKIEREEARVPWDGEHLHVCRVVRAFDPKPGAFTSLGGADVKLFGARPVADRTGTPGEVLAVDDGLVVACGTGAVRIAVVQPSGKRRMPVQEWVRGRAVRVGDTLGV